MRVRLCGFRHISASALGAGASRVSFITVFERPLQVTVLSVIRDHFPVCPVCKVGVSWPNSWMNQDATWYGGRPRPGDSDLNGDPAPQHKGAQQLPHFAGHVCCGKTVAHLSNC